MPVTKSLLFFSNFSWIFLIFAAIHYKKIISKIYKTVYMYPWFSMEICFNVTYDGFLRPTLAFHQKLSQDPPQHELQHQCPPGDEKYELLNTKLSKLRQVRDAQQKTFKAGQI